MALTARDYLADGYVLDVEHLSARARLPLTLTFALHARRPGWWGPASALVTVTPDAGGAPLVRRSPQLSPDCAEMALALFGSLLMPIRADLAGALERIRADGGRPRALRLRHVGGRATATCWLTRPGMPGEGRIWALRLDAQPSRTPSPHLPPGTSPEAGGGLLEGLWTIDERITRLLPPPGAPLRP